MSTKKKQKKKIKKPLKKESDTKTKHEIYEYPPKTEQQTEKEITK
jgi:hypothetical protein